MSAVELPYRCEKLRSETLRRPCERNVAKVRELREKFPNALLGPLEHCLACQGEHLVVREGAVSHLEGKTRPGVELVDPPIVPQGQDILAEKEIKAPLPLKEEPGMPGVVKFKDEDEAKRFLGPGKIPAGSPPRCPRHPEEPQVACSPDSKRAGQYLGACKICMAERKVGRKGKDKMTPAVARALGKQAAGRDPHPTVTSPPVPFTPVVMKKLSPDQIARWLAGSSEDPEKLPDIPHNHACKNHPDRPAKIDSLGRSMALCQECLSIPGYKSGVENHKRGLTTPPVSIPLNQAKYAELKAWLEEQAEENERSLLQEIMFRLKLAMRAAMEVRVDGQV